METMVDSHSHIQSGREDEPLVDIKSSPSRTRGRGSNSYLYFIVCIALQAPFIMGMTIGYTSPATPKMGFLDKEELTWFGSLLNIGAIIGGPTAGFLLQRVGRKLSIMAATVPMVAGWVLIGTSEYIPCLYMGRILTGMGTGMISLAVPNYISEVAPPSLRGFLGSCFQVACTIGILFVYCLGIPLTYYWLALTGAALTSLLGVTSVWIVETPRFLLIRRLRNEAASVLQRLRGALVDVNVECREIEDALDNSDDVFVWSDFLSPSLYKPLLISLTLMFVQQFSGINAVMFYTTTIFKTAAPAIAPSIATVIVGGIQVAFTCVAAMLVDRLGRKVLLIVGAVAMSVSCVAFGLYYQLAPDPNSEIAHKLSPLSLVSINVYIIGFSLAWGPIPWLIMSEIFPAKAKGAASGIATAFNWTCSFLVTKFFISMQDAMTPQGIFWFYGAICFCGAIFVALFVPETKGRSLEEIEAVFSKNGRRSR